jgi:probable F420-dependent oxidoreductase
MKVGVHVPQWGPSATRDGVLAVARTAEEAGLDSVWVADHIVFPLRSGSVYPYRAGGVPFAPEDGFLEAMTTLAAIAGATERVSIGTSVLVLPMRNPLLFAKEVATLDVLSGGRTILALGAGWWEEEFIALDAPFRGRGRRLDEQIQILRRLWSDGSLAWDGESFRFEEVVCEPRPVQPGGPPLWIGGTGPRARRRAARLGDGWHGLGARTDEIAAGRQEIAGLAAQAGRDPGAVSISTSTGLPAEPERQLQRMLDLADCGLGHVVLNVRGETIPELCSAIERFAGEILPAIRTTLADRR